MLSIISWVGNLFIIIGLWKIGNKTRTAFLYSIGGETLWTIYALGAGNYALAFICCVFNGMALRNYFKWGH